MNNAGSDMVLPEGLLDPEANVVRYHARRHYHGKVIGVGMMDHVVTEDELADYVEEQRQAWHPFASSAGVGSEVKRLEFCFGQVAPVYRVTIGSRATYVGILKETAVREYNALA